MELVDFLLARIAEDEKTAREAAAGRYPNMDVASLEAYVEDEDSDVTIGGGDLRGGTGSSAVAIVLDGGRSMARHIARHDPARVLAECEAKRRIVEEYQRSVRAVGDGLSGSLRRVLLALALPYAGHSDYDPAWRP